jgi:invasion protein IalB
MNSAEILNNIAKIMKSRYTIAVILIAVATGIFSLSTRVEGKDKEADKAAPPAKEAPAPATEAWFVRCNEAKEGQDQSQKRGRCEAVQKLLVAETGQRFAEFAIGYPAGKEAARGVVIMPLGVMLPKGIEMSVDDGQKFEFQYRFCDQRGCFAYLSLNDAVMDLLKKGKEASFVIMDANGNNLRVNMTLVGLSKTLKEVQ